MHTCAHTLTPHRTHPGTYLGNSVSPYLAEWVFVCFSVLRMEPWFSPVLMHTNEALRPELRPQRGGNMLTDDDLHSWSQQRRGWQGSDLETQHCSCSVSTHRRRGACPLRRKNKAAPTRYSVEGSYTKTSAHAEPSHAAGKRTPPHTQLDATHVQVCARYTSTHSAPARRNHRTGVASWRVWPQLSVLLNGSKPPTLQNSNTY